MLDFPEFPVTPTKVRDALKAVTYNLPGYK